MFLLIQYHRYIYEGWSYLFGITDLDYLLWRLKIDPTYSVSLIHPMKVDPTYSDTSYEGQSCPGHV